MHRGSWKKIMKRGRIFILKDFLGGLTTGDNFAKNAGKCQK